MYSLIIYIYKLTVTLAALFGNKKARQMVRGQRETWRRLREGIAPGDRPIWFHAASLGEFEQGRPLMERLRREHPGQKILLTFFSPSGYEVRKNYDGADVICYLPFDTMPAARRFVRLAHPEMAFFIKYEFWADYLFQLHRHHVPVYSVSSIFRPSQVFFRWWNCGYSAVLRWVTHFYVQNEESRDLLAGKGFRNVTVVGDTRFDRVIDIRNNAKPLPLVEQFLKGKAAERVFVAGSSWEPDEDVYLDYFQDRDWTLVIAPHVVSEERITRLKQRLETLGFAVKRYSELAEYSKSSESSEYSESSEHSEPSDYSEHSDHSEPSDNSDYSDHSDHSEPSESPTPSKKTALLLDCYGLLSSVYRYATIAYVGGGFGVGIHNVPEAAVYGVPVIIGPNNKKFREAQALLQSGGCREVSSTEDFARVMDNFQHIPSHLLEAGKASHDYIHSNAGAADLIYTETLAQL